MAFGVQAIYSGGTVSLTDKSPYGLLSAKGMAGAPVRRVTSRGPAQDGDSDLGYRLQPREIELEIGFFATTDAILDAYRDTLMAAFKPLSATPVYLRVTRDDGEVRQLDCYAQGSIDIQLRPDHRPGHYHVATVRLYAPDSAYYDTTPGTATATGSVTIPADWYLAGGAIGTAQVLMSGGTPAQGAVWSYTGTVASNAGWTLAYRSGKETPGGTPTYAFYLNNNDGAGEFDAAIWAQGVTYWSQYDYAGSVNLGTAFMPAGTANYFFTHTASTAALANYDYIYQGRTYVAAVAAPGALSNWNRPLPGSAGRWRSNAANAATSRWTATIPLYALYSPPLSDAQRNALDTYMGGDGGAAAGSSYLSASLTYAGDLPEYPVISIRGPITGLIMNNVATGDSIAMGTNAIANGETYIFDLRPGYKTVTLNGVNKRDKLASYSDWDEWHLAPSPTSAQGANPILIYGSNTSGSTQISIVYYNRYSSY